MGYEPVACHLYWKTTIAGGCGLYLMLADRERGAEVYAAATKRDQAKIVFNDAVAMIDSSPMLKRYLNAFTREYE